MADIAPPKTLEAAPEINGIAVLFLSIYLGMVVYKGNARELWTMLSEEGKYFRWASALFILWFIWRSSGRNKIVGGLMTTALLAMLIILATSEKKYLGNFMDSFNKFFDLRGL